MRLKIHFNCGLAFVLTLSLAMANIKAEEAEDVSAEDVPAMDVYVGQTEQELIFVTALNEYRTARGLHPVEVNAELSSACRAWSTRMRQNGRLSHDPLGGTEICAQIAQENGMNALRVWQRSPAHNAILLSSRIDTIGIGSDGIWWTMRGIQKGAERAVFRTSDLGDEIVGVTIGRIPMSVSPTRVQRTAGDVLRAVNTTTPSTEVSVEEVEDMVGRVPMSVAGSGVQRVTSTTTPFRFLFR